MEVVGIDNHVSAHVQLENYIRLEVIIILILVTYDVNTETPAGRTRLHRIAKACVNHGQRVQNSVFECQLDAAQFRLLKDKLQREMDPATDSLRFYILGNQYKGKVEHLGAKPSFDVTEPLVI